MMFKSVVFTGHLHGYFLRQCGPLPTLLPTCHIGGLQGGGALILKSVFAYWRRGGYTASCRSVCIAESSSRSARRVTVNSLYINDLMYMHKPTPQGVGAAVSYIEIDLDDEGQRLDNFLTRRFPDVPKSRLYKAIRSGEVRVNKGRTNAKYKIVGGDVVRIPPLASSPGGRVSDDSSRVAHFWLDAVRDSILYEDDDFFILNKPSGLAIHGGSGLKYGLIEVLRQLRPEAKRLELVHRLDRDTSGCIMIAKKGSALRQLHAALRERKVTKRYQALVFGKWPRSIRFIEAPLHKVALPSGERVVRVSEQGQASRTEFSVLNRYPGATLVEAVPVTGRTHQIRVHAAHQGHCLLGDDKYAHQDAMELAASIGLNRLFLHAASLSLIAPSGKRLEIHAPLGDTLQEVLTRCVNRI